MNLKETQFRYWDRLYGQRFLASYELEVCQTPEFARLNRVSLSVSPTWAHPLSMCASRGEHCRGVSHLGRVFVQDRDFPDGAVNVVFAALLHDLGHPPFSHASEMFMREMTGKGHEEVCEEIIFNSRISSIIKSYGGDPLRVVQLICGKVPPMSDLVHGTIDLDNLDNTLRFGLSMGIIPTREYEPERIARGFLFNGSDFELAGSVRDEVEKWERCRERVYQFVYGRENSCIIAMLVRALGIVFRRGDLPASFFQLTDDQATEFLTYFPSPYVYLLMKALLLWQFYDLVMEAYYEPVQAPLFVVREHHGWRGKWQLSEALALAWGLQPHEVCVFLSEDRTRKHIRLPFREEDGSTSNHVPLLKSGIILKVFVHPQVARVRSFSSEDVEGVLRKLS